MPFCRVVCQLGKDRVFGDVYDAEERVEFVLSLHPPAAWSAWKTSGIRSCDELRVASDRANRGSIESRKKREGS